MKERIYFVLVIILIQMGCSFITTVAGSFVGNLGADLVEEKIQEEKMKKKLQEEARQGLTSQTLLIQLSIPF